MDERMQLVFEIIKNKEMLDAEDRAMIVAIMEQDQKIIQDQDSMIRLLEVEVETLRGMM